MKTKLLIFGITGDLSRRKLLPAIKAIIETGSYNDLSIIGISRRQVDIEDLLISSVGDAGLAAIVSIFTMDLALKSDYRRLQESINLQDDEQLVVYLSVPPQAATQIVDFLGEAGLNSTNVKILFEKPFGVNLESAHDVIARTAHYYSEDRIYRIDHFLAKEMAQNIVAFRAGNAVFGHLWNNQAIERIEVIAAEKIGIEGRADFYEPTGALRDLVQGHLMQLLALTLMDIPDDFNWDKLPYLRLQALAELKIADPAAAVRAQYEGYQAEVGNIGSMTETFVSLELESTAERWQKVPIRLITGKALASKMTEVRIFFKKFHEKQNNCLIFRIQPNEGVEIDLFTKKPGYDRNYETQKLEFTYDEGTVLPDAYEQVLVDAIRSKKSLFTTSKEVIRSWEILQLVQQAWEMDNHPLPIYKQQARIEEINA